MAGRRWRTNYSLTVAVLFPGDTRLLRRQFSLVGFSLNSVVQSVAFFEKLQNAFSHYEEITVVTIKSTILTCEEIGFEQHKLTEFKPWVSGNDDLSQCYYLNVCHFITRYTTLKKHTLKVLKQPNLRRTRTKSLIEPGERWYISCKCLDNIVGDNPNLVERQTMFQSLKAPILLLDLHYKGWHVALGQVCARTLQRQEHLAGYGYQLIVLYYFHISYYLNQIILSTS